MEILNELMDCSKFEMATLKKKRSGFPVNLYLDDSGSYVNGGHAPRIKFQANRNDSSDTRLMIPMTISDDPEIFVDYKQQLDGINYQRAKATLVCDCPVSAACAAAPFVFRFLALGLESNVTLHLGLVDNSPRSQTFLRPSASADCYS